MQIILSPGLEPGAAEVFLEFICYSGGPLPEELLPEVKASLITPLDMGMKKSEWLFDKHKSEVHKYIYFNFSSFSAQC